MNDQLSMFEAPNSPGTPSVTSSPGSVGGLMLCPSRAGENDQSGPGPARASRSLRPARATVSGTVATSGLIFADSLMSADLQQSLESRLRRRLGAAGSMEYELTWKQWGMRSGLPICALRASVPPIFASGFTGWPTPRGEDAESSGMRHSRGIADTLTAVSRLAGWATPTSRDHKDGASTLENTPVNSLLGRQVQLAGWVSPTAQDASRGSLPSRPWDTGVPLSQQVQLAGWPSPNTPSGGPNSNREKRGAGGPDLEEVARWVSRGDDTTSCNAQTEKRGALRPEHSRWLMGYPPVWDVCGVMAMQSFPRLRQGSLRRSLKQEDKAA
ncbi:hypothetical protein UFOVP130_11 [uncultured Caudovirales phage]|uniref:Uncharacterized protein n=1 Tax=uncultured Caudovirales phage TaxID=2100421 RepID=A0A6J5LFU9_9CAUD|nr:hypothetical protein UFOVP130_11 [uncultured Caudovirales phage]